MSKREREKERERERGERGRKKEKERETELYNCLPVLSMSFDSLRQNGRSNP